MSTQQIAEKVLHWVTQQNAEADLVMQTSQSLTLKALDGRLDEHSVNSSFIVGLRVVSDGQVGMASSEAVDDESLKFMVDQALINARFQAPQQHERIPQILGQERAEEPSLQPEDDTDIDAKINFIVGVEQALLAREGIRNVPYNALSDVTYAQALFNSHGRHTEQQARRIMAYAYPLAEENGQTAMAPGMMAGRHFHELNAERIITTAYDDSRALLAGGPIQSGQYDVIFAPNAQAELLGAFSLMWSGKAAMDQVNPMRDKLGQTVFDRRLNFVDQPRNTSGLGYEAFDAEGFSTAPVTLVEHGVLKTLAHNSATAAYFDVANTAHAQRGAKAALSVGLHQLHLLAGDASPDQLHEGCVFEVTQLDGLHSGTKPISGDFSCGASGYLWRNGERVQSVRGVTVAGNLYQMFNRVVNVGNQMLWNDSRSSCMAAIRFADLSVTGQ